MQIIYKESKKKLHNSP